MLKTLSTIFPYSPGSFIHNNPLPTQWTRVTPDNPKPDTISMKNMFTTNPCNFLKILIILYAETTFLLFYLTSHFNPRQMTQ